MDDFAILAQPKYFSRQDHFIFLAIGIVLLLGYVAAVCGLWFLVVRHLPRRAALIGLGFALFLHAASAAIAMVQLLRFDGGFDPGRILVGSLEFSFWKWLWLTLPVIVLSLIRLRRD